jgi:hypothetical protein
VAGKVAREAKGGAMSKELSIDDIRERIVSTEKVAHVTFYIVKIEARSERKVHCSHEYREDCYHVYSESEKTGLRLISQSFEYQQNDTGFYDDALVILRGEIQRLEEVLERKRAGFPTQKQVHFLFREKIPIPVDLTWGQASDLIDERLSQKEYEKEVKQQARLAMFNGFEVGMEVFQPLKNYMAYGKITKLTSNNAGIRYAYVRWESKDYTSRETIDTLYKTQAEARSSVQQFKTGDRIQHVTFGTGLILSSEVNHGKELVSILFDKPAFPDGRREGRFYTTSSQQLQKVIERVEDLNPPVERN